MFIILSKIGRSPAKSGDLEGLELKMCIIPKMVLFYDNVLKLRFLAMNSYTHKTGSRNKSVKYRPVSLTSVICKLLETIIRF